MRLLVMSCSARKSKATGLLPAFQRYTGPSYSIVKKASSSLPAEEAFQTKIAIISAKYGYLDFNTPIPYYDLMMTETLAKMHRSKAVQSLSQFVDDFDFKEIFLFLSPVYAQAVMPMAEWTDGIPYCFVKGGMGYRNQFLKNWFLGLTTVTQDGLLDRQTGQVLISPKENHSRLRV